jgi:hypothetical protein
MPFDAAVSAAAAMRRNVVQHKVIRQRVDKASDNDQTESSHHAFDLRI